MQASVFREKFYFSEGRIETALVLQKGIPLKHLAAFELLGNERGREILRDFYEPYLSLATKHSLGYVMNSPTWRASCDWGFKLGYTHDELFALNKQSVKFIRELARNFPSPHVIISGTVGPRAEGYSNEIKMTAEQSKVYHLEQIKAFALADADLVTALNISYCEEAIGVIKAAYSFGLPVGISFTAGIEGKLPGGESLKEVIERIDTETDSYADHFAINCADPDFLVDETGDTHWKKRVLGVRSNEFNLQFLSSPFIRMVGGCCLVDINRTEEMIEELLRYDLSVFGK